LRHRFKLNTTVIVADAAGADLLVERRGGVLDFTVPEDGSYVIKVHELTFKGGPAFTTGWAVGSRLGRDRPPAHNSR
jgi:hypothetical protein